MSGFSYFSYCTQPHKGFVSKEPQGNPGLKKSVIVWVLIVLTPACNAMCGCWSESLICFVWALVAYFYCVLFIMLFSNLILGNTIWGSNLWSEMHFPCHVTCQWQHTRPQGCSSVAPAVTVPQLGTNKCSKNVKWSQHFIKQDQDMRVMS